MIWQTFIAFETIIWSGLKSQFSKWVPFCQTQLQILLVSASATTNIAKVVDKSQWDQEKPEHHGGSNYWCKGWSVSKKSNRRERVTARSARKGMKCQWGAVKGEHSVVEPMNPLCPGPCLCNVLQGSECSVPQQRHGWARRVIPLMSWMRHKMCCWVNNHPIKFLMSLFKCLASLTHPPVLLCISWDRDKWRKWIWV